MAEQDGVVHTATGGVILGCDGSCAASTGGRKTKCYVAAVLFPESPASAFRNVGAAQVMIGRDCWIVPARRPLTLLIEIFRGVRRLGPTRPIRDRLVESCGSPRRHHRLTLLLDTAPTPDGDFCCLGQLELSLLHPREWALLVEAIPAAGVAYELAPTVGRAWRMLEGTAVSLPAFRDLVADMARGLETQTDLAGRRALAAELRAAVDSCARLRDAARAVEDLREQWMCSSDPERSGSGTLALSDLLAAIPRHTRPRAVVAGRG